VPDCRLTEGKGVELRVVNTSSFKDVGEIATVLCEHFEKFCNILTLSQNSVKVKYEEGTQPEDRQICLVFMDDDWHRAVKVAVDGEVKYTLIDFGILADTEEIQRISKIPKALALMPIYTNLVSIKSKFDFYLLKKSLI
jgi:hypothetical protein